MAQSASTVIRALADLWPVVERWIQHFGDRPLTPQELMTLLRHLFPTLGQEEWVRTFARLQRNELVVEIAKSQLLELNRHLLEYGQHLLREQTLGLADEVLVLVQDLERLQGKLEAAVGRSDGDEAARQSALIDDRLRRIIKHLAENERAIQRLAERVRAAGDGQSLASRYAEVLDAFDRYIEPMLTLLDLQGTARALFAGLEQSVSRIGHELSVTGRLPSLRDRLGHLLTRLLEMERLARESVRSCADTLLPLRDQLRRSTLVSQAAARLLARLRRNQWTELDRALPVLSSEGNSQRLANHRQLLAFLGALMRHQDSPSPLLDEADFSRPRPANVPELGEVLSRLHSASSSAAGAPLLQALLDHYPALDTDELLYLHQQLRHHPQLQLAPQPASSQLVTASHRLTLFDAALQAPAAEPTP